MILLKLSLNVDVLKTNADKYGLALVTNVNINQGELCLVSIYVPNDQT